ncbi:MAG TPA: hypothetical protein VNI79_01280 [Sphingomicrobium sp.]|nr:hypothetical protein [Sphingomicrobium sp.]
MKYAAALILLGGSASCADAPANVIDGSSPAAFAETTEAARNDLPLSDRLVFDSAIASVPARRYANSDPASAARTTFDGMTAADVVATERARITRGK